MKIVCIWLYKKLDKLLLEECKPSKTNVPVPKEVIGIFKYYALEGELISETTRAEADRWRNRTGEKVETWRGYPAFMHDKGYRF